jgi:hypothetical protein
MIHSDSAKIQQRFSCEICDYKTSRQSNYSEHLKTKKHKMIQSCWISSNEGSSDVKLYVKEKKYICDCGNAYTHRNNLIRHKKKCINVDDNQDKISILEEKNNILEEKNKILLEENNKFLLEQNNKLIDIISKNPSSITNNLNTNNITNNNNVNINIFLNEECKNALSMDEFLKTLQITVGTLMLTKEKGLADGISNIFIESMNKLPLNQRPLHCTDIKRETLYIKNETWEKDTNNEKIKDAIKKVSGIQIKNINRFKEAKPHFMEDPDDKDDFIGIIKATTDDINDKQDKIVRTLCKSVYLNNKIINGN